MAPEQSKPFLEKIQAFARNNGNLNVALFSPSFSIGGKDINKPNEGLGMESQALAHLINTAISKLSAADQAEFEKDGWHRSGQVWEGFLHMTLATLTVRKELAHQQQALKSAMLDGLMKTPFKCKPGRLFSTPGTSKKDRPKIILELVFDANDLQRVQLIADVVKEAVGANVFESKIYKKEKESQCNPEFQLHMIIAKNYGAPKDDVPNNDLLSRLGEQMKALDLTISFRQLAVSAAGNELGYAVDPMLLCVCKLPVVYWQVGLDGPQDKSTVLWMPGDKEAEVLDRAMKSQEAHKTIALQALMGAYSEQQVALDSQVQRVMKFCTPVSLSDPLPPYNPGVLASASSNSSIKSSGNFRSSAYKGRSSGNASNGSASNGVDRNGVYTGGSSAGYWPPRK